MHKVLIVDDERPARDFMAGLIVRYLPDSKITQAESARKALQCLQTDQYDLMFLDIEMPNMTGLQMLGDQLTAINGKGGMPYTYIVTAFRKYEYALTGFRLGILDYIEKPIHDEKIYQAVKLYLDRKKAGTIDLNVFNGYRRVQINRLLAIKTIGRGKVMVYTSDALLPEVSHSLKQLYPQLPSNFRYIRRDCIVNVHEVKHYNLKAREIYFACQNTEYAFAVSRENMKELAALFNPGNIKNDEV